jgi:hypothetical protein
MMHQFVELKNQYVQSMLERLPEDLDELREEVATFEKYPSIRSCNIDWVNDNNIFLEKIGLPVSAPSMLEFGVCICNSSDFVEIGRNNYGDKIAIQKSTGVISSINHDFNGKLEYINKDAMSLFKSICAFQLLLQGDTNYLGRMKEIDSEALTEGAWWNSAYLSWKTGSQ